MKYNVLENIKLKTSKRDLDVLPGQVITLKDNIAIRLINEGRIVPIGKATYKIYSKILDDYLWIVATDKELKELIAEGIQETIYTHEEVSRMMDEGVSKEGLKTIHKIKKAFSGSSIEEISDEDKNI
jgi:hypothetical protein